MKVGFVTVIGRPNVGKSSLLNEILNYKLSITSSVPQTTRNQIKAIYNDDESQIIFLDTPGIHRPKQKLGETLNKVAFRTIKDADFNLFLSPINEKMGPGDSFIIKNLDMNKSAAIITKIDLGNIKTADQKVNILKELGFKHIIATSIKKRKSIEDITKFLKNHLKEAKPFYAREDITDVSIKFIAQELIRESAIEKTREEVPHSLAIQIHEFNETENKTVIKAIIYVERNSQKGILIGKDGMMIKTIGKASRNKIEKMMETKVHLDLKIKVAKNWTNKQDKIKKMGY